MYTLYHSPGRASFAIHRMLIHMDLPFDARLVDVEAWEHKGFDYLGINPDGMVPALVIDGVPHTESAASARATTVEREGLEIWPGASR